MLRPAMLGVAVAALALTAACSHSQRPTMSPSPSASVTPAGPDGWRDLSSLSAWRGYKEPQLPAGWSETGGVISKSASVEDLVSRDQYGDFELSLDWKLSPGGNAGIFYRATEEYEKIYWSGTEYQLLDDARHPDGRNRLTSAAAAYGLYAPPAGVVHAAGEWNSTRIVVRGTHVEHWLNGQKVVEYDYGSPDWEAKVKNSKFGEWPHYGRATRGYIGIQGDHDGTLMLRNIKVRNLP